MLIGISEATTKIAGQRHDDRRATDRQRHAGGDQRPEDEDERQGGQRQRDDLAPTQVGLGHGLDVAVEGRAAGQLDRQPGRVVQALAQDRQRVGRIVGRQVEEDDVVGRVPVGRDLAAAPAGATRRGRRAGRVGTSRTASAAAVSNGGRAGLERRAARRR